MNLPAKYPSFTLAITGLAPGSTNIALPAPKDVSKINLPFFYWISLTDQADLLEKNRRKEL